MYKETFVPVERVMMSRRDCLLRVTALLLVQLGAGLALVARPSSFQLCDEQGMPLATEEGERLAC
jgi:hypothetical protein